MKLSDPLALREFSALLRDPVFRGRGVPPGDGRPVLLIPGFLSGDWALRVMDGWLKRIGYHVYLSGILLNVHHSERMLSGLRRKVVEIEKENNARVSLVGHPGRLSQPHLASRASARPFPCAAFEPEANRYTGMSWR